MVPSKEPPKLALFSLSKEKRTSTDNAAALEPKRGRTEPSAEGSLGPKGEAGPPGAGKPTLSQAFDIRTFAKGVEQDIKKMAKVAIQNALPGDKILNDVVVRTIGDINKTVGDISSTIEIHRETRNNAVYAAGVLNNLQSWQQKVDARLDELHNVGYGPSAKTRLGARHPPHFPGTGPWDKCPPWDGRSLWLHHRVVEEAWGPAPISARLLDARVPGENDLILSKIRNLVTSAAPRPWF
jgi:hypothetical protein